MLEVSIAKIIMPNLKREDRVSKKFYKPDSLYEICQKYVIRSLVII